MQITVSSYSKGPSAADERLRCAVVTPVGPGHELLAEDSAESVAAAFDRNAGPFSDIDIIRVDDTQGLLGRSEARNRGVREAQRRQAQWIFFLDADDLMHPDAFGAMSAYHRDHDAVWGLICELTPDEEGYVEREGQVREIERVEAILVNDPTRTLQMGHFVRTAAAAANPFNTALDCGEDFDYYLRVWQACRCRKVPVPLFLNRRGLPSTGPRSATGKQWLRAVTAMLAAHCAARGIQARFTLEGEPVAFFVSNPFDMLQRHFLAGRFFEHEELRALRAVLRPGATLLEVGANVGNHVVYYARFLRPRKIIVVEPLTEAVRDLKRNLELNQVTCADLTLVGVAAADARRRYKAVTPDANNLAATRLVPDSGGAIEAAPLDELVREPVDFIKIDVEGMEMEVLAGAMGLIGRHHPKLMVEVGNDQQAAFERWRQDVAYEITRRFAYVYASNFILEPK